MPHTTAPYAGFQALILCGPGASLSTFTSKPKEFPKALIPIANRPMVWYPLDWCYRMGITDITLITPPESAAAIESALAQNPHLTGLPAPRPVVLAPKGLEQTSGTGIILKLPEVQRVVTTDFVVLPCDIVSEMDGSAFLQTWMTLQGGLGGAARQANMGDFPNTGGEKSGRRGGLGVWYPVKNLEGVTPKLEQTDFVATVARADSCPVPSQDQLAGDVRKLVLSIPTTTVKDLVEEQGALTVRYSLLKQHGRVAIKTGYRDAHIYFFPRWTLDMIKQNDFESLAEDVIGRWAKASWQTGLAEKLGLQQVFNGPSSRPDTNDDPMASSMTLEEEIDLQAMSSTTSSSTTVTTPSVNPPHTRTPPTPTTLLPTPPTHSQPTSTSLPPPFLAYLQPTPTSSTTTTTLLHRVDTPHLLLLTSLHLAKLPLSTPPSHPFSHTAKIAHPHMIHQHSRVDTESLIAENVSVAARVTVKECVVGVGCEIGAGVRLTRCVLMDGVVVGQGVVMSGCVVGRRARVGCAGAGAGGVAGKGKGKGKEEEENENGEVEGEVVGNRLRTKVKETRLVDCEVQGGYVVDVGTEAKGEKFMSFDGLDMGPEDDDDEEEDDDHDHDIGHGE